MPTVHFTDAAGAVRDVQGNAGDSVMETAVRNGVTGIVAECGGSLSCATCHVFVREDCLSQLPAMEDMEDEMLYGTAVDRADNSRLSCQLRLTDELELFVTTPETQV
ncbi:2Fe-2S iron-sulfur cluster-binding protein [Arthrobacter sp. AL08]|uniref:2Fe-2S iron-sulfur cluster-binding protein n=1 Tax=Micrococcaceae TaxID=1268 RepID=UPI001CFF729D|nr:MULTISPECIES: 2Fe-2S iron-sulfur cluster-binding protein [Micrococcaceae]MCB5280807.1 Rhodocoxin [Arthrobacter sp. ES1]MDI3240853.1 2Fe-2S iron-sulfur cluster-binding protein [Arthrobacter sp. AL05]MDI3277171.1 2Fe-2S iron-sulfur cluster-binding protein [Arthrobacter sp. AL08]MDJ0352420.1 2Fe-2S iron-sulfur cluster-binding protein [Pseudarthrobacter sp. PH31-O2]WGZ79503.1 2Fe-2S iron-sulfur cluster-binding protein [Arthrobacter sp. EM1]